MVQGLSKQAADTADTCALPGSNRRKRKAPTALALRTPCHPDCTGPHPSTWDPHLPATPLLWQPDREPLPPPYYGSRSELAKLRDDTAAVRRLLTALTGSAGVPSGFGSAGLPPSGCRPAGLPSDCVRRLATEQSAGGAASGAAEDRIQDGRWVRYVKVG